MIGPGPITRSGARRASEFVRQSDANRQAVERRKKTARDRPWAKITAYDSATRAYSWTERTFDDRGLRIDKPGGRQGTKDWMPAYAFGDGMVATSFPLEVQLRRTVETATKGPVYEFPLYCGCAVQSGSGSGLGPVGGGGTVGPFSCSVCYPTPIPRRLWLRVENAFLFYWHWGDGVWPFDLVDPPGDIGPSTQWRGPFGSGVYINPCCSLFPTFSPCVWFPDIFAGQNSMHSPNAASEAWSYTCSPFYFHTDHARIGIQRTSSSILTDMRVTISQNP